MTIKQMESKLCPFMSTIAPVYVAHQNGWAADIKNYSERLLKVNCMSNCVAFANDNNVKSEFYEHNFYCARLPRAK